MLDKFRKTFPRFLATSALMGGGVACSVATAETSDAVLLRINAAIAAIASIGGTIKLETAKKFRVTPSGVKMLWIITA